MRKVLCRGIVIINIVTIILIGMLRTIYMLGAFDVSIIPLVLSSFVITRRDFLFFKQKRDFLWNLFLTVLFVCMLSIEQVIRVLVRMDNEPIHLIFKIIYIPVLFLAVYISINGILQYATAERGKVDIVPNGDDGVALKENALKKFMGLYRPTWLIAMMVVFIVLAYYPGEFNADANACFQQVMNGVWDDWHTVSFLMFMKVCMTLFENPFMVTIVQAICYILVQNYAIAILWKAFQKRKLCIYYAIASITLGFIGIRYISGFCKDITYFEAMFAFSISVLDYLIVKHACKRQYLCMAVFGAAASFFRHGAIVSVLCVYFVLFIYVLHQKTTKEAACDKKRELARIGGLFLIPIVANCIFR